MDDFEKIEWQMPEYEHKEKNNDWFWALGVAVFAGSITCIIFKNYFFAVLLIISGFLVALFSIKPPELVTYELNHKGLKIKGRLFEYNKIKAFWVQKDTPYTLFIKSDRVIMPIIAIPIDISLANNIKKIMLTNKIPEEEMKAHFSEKVMDSIGF